MRQPINLFKVFMAPNAADDVSKILTSGFLGQGKVNENFETALRKKFGHDYLNTVNSATAAEHLSFQMLKTPNPQTGWEGLDQDSEVLVTSLSCLATMTPIIANGLRIKWLDIDPETLNIDLDDLERKITPKTRVINFVHWGGYPVDLDRVKEIQFKTKELFGFKPAVVEDMAHALGSKYKGKYIGTQGNLATASLQAIKSINAGDGGILFCPNYDLYIRSRRLRWFGIDRDDPTKTMSRCDGDVVESGHKFHMNDINSAIGLANLRFLDVVLGAQRTNADFYDKELAGISGISFLKRQAGFDSSFWLYTVLVEDKESFTRMMHEKGIMVNHAHQRCDQHTCMKEFRSHLPNLDKVMPMMTNLPNHYGITKEEREYIVDCIRKGW